MEKIENKRQLFRRRVSVQEDKNTQNQLKKEIEYWRKKKDNKLNKIDNILDDEKNFPTLISPLYGDPNNRDVLQGGFLPPNHFQRIGTTITADNGEKYIAAGPRYHVALDNRNVKACIVTCGGLCPGLNVIIRELVNTLKFNYGVEEIYGIKWGYGGFYKNDDFWVKLGPDDVRQIHTLGGTILGTCRGGFDGEKISEAIIKRGVNMGFFIGGDGTHRGIKELCRIFKEKKKKIILIGIPKTIDNDIPIIDSSFGLETAIEESVHIIRCANVEANCNANGIGLVKLFGRSSGFVAMYSTLASRDVNICLVPEVPFNLYGENGLIDYIFKRIKIKHHCVIVVGEGAGFAVRDFNIELSGKTDKSGNPVLPDIGLILKEEIKKRAEERGIDINLKYINPTYIIRACPPNSYDVKYCVKLAQGAINGAFAGFTNFSIGIVNHHPCFIPINKISQDGVIRKIQTSDEDYIMMLATTGQPSFYPQVTLTKDIKIQTLAETKGEINKVGEEIEIKDTIREENHDEDEDEEKSSENSKSDDENKNKIFDFK